MLEKHNPQYHCSLTSWKYGSFGLRMFMAALRLFAASASKLRKQAAHKKPCA